MITPTTHSGPLGTAEPGWADPLDGLRHPVYGAAHLDTDGTVTAGTYADGRPAWWRLGDGRQARHTALIGRAGTGKTVLARSLLDAAAAADVPAQVIDLAHGKLDQLPHPVASSIAAARTVLAELHQIAVSCSDRGGRGARPRLLVIDGLITLTRDPAGARLLNELSQVAGRAGIAIVSTAHSDRGLDEFGSQVLGGDTARDLRTRLAEELVLLRTARRTHYGLLGADVDLPLIPGGFADGATTAGVGYLPRRSSTPFRAWLP